MRTLPRWLPVLLMLGAALPAAAQQDRQAQQAQRRLQLQVQQLQQQLTEAQAAKAKAESEKAELARQLDGKDRQAASAAQARKGAEARLQEAEAARTAGSARVAELEQQLADEKQRSADTLAAAQRELAQAGATLKGAEGREADLQARFREQLRQVGECSEKNERLLKVGAELITLYRNKGVVDALRQREPVLGLSDVAAFNLMQDYRDQLDAARFVPGSPR